MSIVNKILEFWSSAGGFAIILLVLSIFSWFWILSLYFKLKVSSFRTSKIESEITDRIIAGESLNKIKEWLYKQKGIVPRIIRYVLTSVKNNKSEMELRYEEASNAEILNIQKEFSVLNSMVKAMPLIGLLGTVAGMVDTFSGLSGSSMNNVSDGISKALLTTQLGLLAALPGVFSIVYLKRNFNRLVLELDRLQFHINALNEAK